MVPALFSVSPQLEIAPLPADHASASTAPAREVVFVESSVVGYSVLLNGLAPDVDGVVLDAAGDGARQMAAFLNGRQGLTAVHIVAHGSQGAVLLGATTLDGDSVATDASALGAIRSALTPDGDVLLWSCDVADGTIGQRFLTALATATGADVAAATHPVGAADQGGSWLLDARTGPVQAAIPFNTAAREAFPNLLSSWAFVAPMNTPRQTQTATLLTNGNVLVAGGSNVDAVAIASAEVYNPTFNTWTPVGSLNQARTVQTATLLPNGKVLVAGGSSGANILSSAELFDPATNTWALAGSLTGPRTLHTATLLPNGKVLVVGGLKDSTAFTATAELYDPATNTWTAVGSLATARGGQTATLLPNGKVLVVGGYTTGGTLASAELFDPATNTWSAAASLSAGRAQQTATLLPNGKVLVVGGIDSIFGSLSSAELYDPASNTWSPASGLSQARGAHTATLLNGKVIVTGGYARSAYLSSVEQYDPVSNTWTAAPALGTPAAFHTATLLTSNQVLVVGGAGGSSVLSNAEVFPAVPFNVGAFRNGTWFLNEVQGDYKSSTTQQINNFGTAGDIPVTGDWMGDGVNRVGVFRPSTGQWFLSLTNQNYTVGTTIQINNFGKQGDVPVVGRWTGASVDCIGVFRPATGQWFLSTTNTNYTKDNTLQIDDFGAIGDVPVVGPWKGAAVDGRTYVGVFRARTSQWFLSTTNTDYTKSNTLQIDNFGGLGDVPKVGDWHLGAEDGRAYIGVFRPGTGQWFLSTTNANYTTAGTLQINNFGGPGDVPVVASWPGDGRDYVGVFRPGSGQWFLSRTNQTYRSGNTLVIDQFGAKGDTPVVGVWGLDGLS
ncbi:MAG: DUF4347 domain-containing protein [Gemmataceae bacterium]|nr:DUF4347 domain-containing protein [Gemmataceae bacterium]